MIIAKSEAATTKTIIILLILSLVFSKTALISESKEVCKTSSSRSSSSLRFSIAVASFKSVLT